MTFQFTDQNFDNEVLQSGTLTLVDFWAPWCGPCKALGPVIDKLAEKYEGQVKIGKINVDENQEMAQKYGIMSIPALKFFQGGEVVQEASGVQSEEFLSQQIDALLTK